MLCDSIAQQDHVNVMVKRFLLLRWSSLLFQARKIGCQKRSANILEVSIFLKGIVFAPRAWRCNPRLRLAV
jgi:hypothetical protein